jgi:hypothetical protein
VLVNTVAAATASSNSPVCSGSTINLTASSGSSYSWAGPNSFTNTTQNPNISNAVAANGGTYTVTVTDSNGCTATATTAVIINTSPSTTLNSSDADNTICTGQSVTFTGGGGTHYQFYLNGSPQGTYSTTNTYVTNTLTNGQSVTVQACNDVIFDGTITETAWGSPIATSAGGPAPSTGFGTGHETNALYVTGGNNNDIYIGLAGNVQNTNRILIFIDSKSGGYNTANFGRTGAPGGINTFNSGTTFDSGFNADYCLVIGTNASHNNYFYDLYTLSASGSNTFLGDNTSSTLEGNLSPTSGSTTQGFEMAIAKSLLGYAGGTIKFFVAYTSDGGFLNNKFLTPAGSGDGNYGSGAVTFGSAAPNPITVDNINAVCCTTSSAIVTTVNALPTAVAGSNSPVCSGNTINLTASGGTSYAWSGPNSFSSAAQNPNISNATTAMAGTYTVTVTNAANCSSTSTTSVVVTILPTASISYAGSPVCSSSGTISPTLTGTSGGTYSSTAGLTIAPSTGIITPSTSTAGTYTVTYTIAASGGCPAVTATTSVTVTALPTASISYAGSPVCSNGGTISPTLTGTSGGTYSSTAGLTIAPSTGIITPSTSTAGTYTVTYTIAAAGGCPAVIATTSVTITALPTATISYTGSPVCSSSGTISPTLTGTSGGTYSSTAGLTIAPSTGIITPSTSTAGTYTVTYTIAAAGGCPAVTANTSVTVTTLPTATISYAGSPVCSNGGTISPTLTGTSGGTYSSTVGLTIASSTGIITPSTSTAGTYTVTYTIAASGGCPAVTATTLVIINAAPTAGIVSSDADNTICSGESVTFTGSGGTHYQFYLDATPQGTYGTTNTFTTTALTNGQSVTVQVCNDVIFDGNFTETAWGSPISTSSGGPASSGFGNNRIDALYLSGNATQLNFGIAGNVVNGSGNKVLFFIDSKTGGFNNLSSWTNRSGSPYYSIENLNGGITFDSGFSPDYIVGINQASGLMYFDLYDMQANTNTFLGTAGSAGLAFTANTGTGDYTKGFEFAISKAALGSPTGNMQVFAMVVNDPGIGVPTTLSNQFLSPAGSAQGNYGNGSVSFGSEPANPITLSSGTNICCTTSSAIVTTVNTPATANAGTPQTVCSNGSITLAGSIGGGATSSTWTAPSGTFSDASSLTTTYTPSITSGTVTLTLTTDDPAGPCVAAVSTVVITVNAAATANAGTPQTVCSNGTITLAGSIGGGATSSTWTASSGTFSDASSLTTTYTPSITSGTVTLTLTTDDPAGPCTAAVSTVVITVNAAATANAGAPQTVCSGGSVTLAGSIGGGATSSTWTASSGTFSDASSLTSTYTPSITSGTVTLTLTTDDPAGPCTAATSTVVITVNESPSVTTSTTNVLCFGQTNGSATANVIGGTPAYTYTWNTSPTQTTQTASNLIAGIYTVIVTDQNTCSTTANATITAPTAVLSASSVLTNETCNQLDNGLIDVSVSGGTSPYTYVWSNGANTEDINPATAGVYVVTITDNNACTTILSQTVLEPSTVGVTIASTNETCNELNNGTATTNVLGGTTPYTYLWSNTATTANISGIKADTYTVTVTDNNNCTTSATTLITQPDVLVISEPLVTNESCAAANNGSIAVSVNGGTTPYTYTWSNAGGNVPTISGLDAGTYELTVTDALNCSTKTIAILVGTNPTPSISIAASATICDTGVANLVATVNNPDAANCGIQWQSSPDGSSWSNISGANGITYTSSALNATTHYQAIYDCTNPCDATSNAVIITVNVAPSISISGTTNVCVGSDATLTATPTGGANGCSIQWESSPNGTTWTPIPGANGTTYTTPVLSVTTYYHATYTCGGDGCTTATSATATVTVTPLPTIIIDGN